MLIAAVTFAMAFGASRALTAGRFLGTHRVGDANAEQSNGFRMRASRPPLVRISRHRSRRAGQLLATVDEKDVSLRAWSSAVPSAESTFTRRSKLSRTNTIRVRYWAAARSAAGVTVTTLPVIGPISLAEVVNRVAKLHPDTRLLDVIGVCSVLFGDRPVSTEDLAELLVPPWSPQLPPVRTRITRFAGRVVRRARCRTSVKTTHRGSRPKQDGCCPRAPGGFALVTELAFECYRVRRLSLALMGLAWDAMRAPGPAEASEP